MKAGEIIRVGDLCISHHVERYIGVALETVVLTADTRNRLTPAECHIFWADVLKVQINILGEQGFIEAYRIVR